MRDSSGTIAVGLVFLVGLLFVLGSLMYNAIHPCLEWQYTGGQTCHTTDSITNCWPDRVCLRRE